MEDEALRQVVITLMNLIETLSAKVKEQAEEIQRLRDEVNRLKGEQGKPKIKANTPALPLASEKERSSHGMRNKMCIRLKCLQVTFHAVVLSVRAWHFHLVACKQSPCLRGLRKLLHITLNVYHDLVVYDEITARRQYPTKRLLKPSWLQHLLADDRMELSLSYRKHNRTKDG
jgi:hypothetical protein